MIITPRRKSYTAEFKLKVIGYAEKINNETGKKNENHAAANLFDVNESIIKSWRKKHILKTTKQTRRAFQTRIAKWPVLEENFDYSTTCRKETCFFHF